MSETPKNIEFIIMKLSADELVIASNVAFIESEENYNKFISILYYSIHTTPFFLIISIDGLI